MLDPAKIFAMAGPLAMLGWVGLLATLFVKAGRPIAWPLAQYAIPAILAAGYVLLLWGGRAAFEEGGFGSIAEVRALFANDGALAAGWLHYLAFDLFVGAWICRDSVSRGIPALPVLPCLPLAFMFGPAGLLLYFAIRAVLRRNREEAVQ